MKKILCAFALIFMFLLTGCSNQIDDLENRVIVIESQSNTEFLARIEALEDAISELENYDDTTLLAQIEALEDYSMIIGPVFSNIPPDQMFFPGSELNLLGLGLTASDNTDGDLTSSITVNITDLSDLSPGNYAVTYSVTDSDGNTETETITLTVFQLVQ